MLQKYESGADYGKTDKTQKNESLTIRDQIMTQCLFNKFACVTTASRIGQKSNQRYGVQKKPTSSHTTAIHKQLENSQGEGSFRKA